LFLFLLLRFGLLGVVIKWKQKTIHKSPFLNFQSFKNLGLVWMVDAPKLLAPSYEVWDWFALKRARVKNGGTKRLVHGYPGDTSIGVFLGTRTVADFPRGTAIGTDLWMTKAYTA